MEDILKFTIEDRIRLYGLLPEKGSYELLKAVKDFEPMIRFNEEETRRFDIKQQVDEATKISHVYYNREVAEAAAQDGESKEIKIPHALLSYMVDRLEKSSQEGELDYPMVEIYEKLVLGKEKVKENVRDASKSSKSNNG